MNAKDKADVTRWMRSIETNLAKIKKKVDAEPV